MATDEQRGGEAETIGAIAVRASLPPTIPSSRADDEEAAERQLLRRLVRRQLPDYLRHASFDGFDPNPDADALALVKRWVDAVERWHSAAMPSGGPSIILTSERAGETVAPGNGKSMLAAAALFDLVDRGVGRVYTWERSAETWPSLMWTSSADLVAQVRSTYGRREGKTAEEIVGQYAWADVLVLDDVGTEPSGDDATSHLFRLMDTRLGKPTFYTSNYSLRDLERRSPEWAKLASRMSAHLKGAVLRGPDRRRPTKTRDAWGEWR